MLALARPAWANTCNFYVSTTGSGTAPGTKAEPTTIANAQTLAQAAGSADRTICLEGGTYVLTANLLATSADAYEVWVPLSGPSTVTLDGNCGTYHVNANGATGFTMDAFTFQNMGNGAGYDVYLSGEGYTFRWNTFLDCEYDCFFGSGVTSSLLDSNTYNGGMTTQPEPGSSFWAAMFMESGTAGNTFSHNTCETLSDGGCVEISNGSGEPAQSNNVISYNQSLNVLSSCDDCGAYYLFDQSASVGCYGLHLPGQQRLQHNGFWQHLCSE